MADLNNNSNEMPEGIESINKLLESVGLTPISDEAEKKADEVTQLSETSPEKTKIIFSDDQKTKHFNLGKAADAPEEEESGQLFLDGYGEAEKPRVVSQAAVERQLKKTRKNLIENFRVLSKETSDKAILEKEPTGEGGKSVADSLEIKKGETLFDAVDRADKKKKGGFLEKGVRYVQGKTRSERKREELNGAKIQRISLKEQKEKRKGQLRAVTVLFALSLVLFFMLCVYAETGALSALFGGSAAVYILLNVLLIALGAFWGRDIMKDGFSSLKAFSPRPAFFVLLCSALTMVQCLSLFVFKARQPSDLTAYTPFFLLSLLSACAADYLKLEGIRHDISVLMRCKQLRSLQTVENKNDAAALGYGISGKDDPTILYSAPCAIPKNVERLAFSGNLQEKLFFVLAIVALCAGAVFAVVSVVISKSGAAFFASLASGFCLCMPALSELVSALIKGKNDSSLSEGSAVVASVDSAARVAGANAIAVDADELFEGRVSKFKTVPGEKMAISDAVVYAAATLKNTRSVLKNEFDSFLEEEGIRLPEAEDVQYEEQLGYACWIAGRRVLVGNRMMLVSHSIEPPDEAAEKEYAGGKNVMYVVVEGVIAALFVADYRVRSDVRRSVRAFNKTGLVLMLSCGDPCLTQEAAARKLMADVAAIRISSTKNCRLVDTYKENAEIQKESGLFCAGQDRNILFLVNGAHDLFEAERLSKAVMLAGLGFCFVLSVVAAILGVSTAPGPMTLCLIQLCWGAVSYFIGKTRIK